MDRVGDEEVSKERERKLGEEIHFKSNQNVERKFTWTVDEKRMYVDRGCEMNCERWRRRRY